MPGFLTLLFLSLAAAAPAPGGEAPDIQPRLVPQLGHSGHLMQALFTPDGRGVITSSSDANVIMWDVATGAQTFTLRGHDDGVVSLALSPDGAILATGSWDHSVGLWDARTGELLHRLQHHRGSVTQVMFIAEGRLLLTAGGGGSVALWEVATGQLVYTLQEDNRRINRMAVSPNGAVLATVGEHGTLALWDLRTAHQISRSSGDEEDIWGVAFSPEGERLLSAGNHPRVRIWDIATGKLLWSRDGASFATWTPRGDRVVTAGGEGDLALRDPLSGEVVRELGGHSDAVVSAVFTADGETMLTASLDGSACLWDLRSGALLHRLDGHGKGFIDARFDPGEAWVVTAGLDGSASLWDAASGARLHRLGRRAPSLESAVFSPDGDHLLAASDEGVVTIWDTGTGAPGLSLDAHSGPLERAAYTRDGRALLTVGTEAAALWSAETGALLQRFAGHEGRMNGAELSPDESLLVTAATDERAIVWDAASGEELERFECERMWVPSDVFAPGGDRLVVLGRASNAEIYELQGGQHLSSINPERDQVTSAAFLDQGDTLGIITLHGSAAVYDATSGGLRLQFDELSDGAWRSSSFSDDRRYGLTIDFDGGAALWETHRGRLIARLDVHKSSIDQARFSPDGKTLLTVADDGAAALWRLEDGALLHHLRAHEAAVSSGVFSADGQRIVTAGEDGTLRVWGVESGELLATLISFEDGTWAVIDRQGRFDTEDLGRLQGVVWTRPFDPLRPLIATSFARDFYTPGLLPALWRGLPLPPVPDLSTTNVLTPTVTLTATPAGADLAVRVEVCGTRDTIPMPDGPRELSSGAQDLRLFLDGRLVFWQDGDLAEGCAVHSATLPLPAGSPRLTVSAHAFNAERVKSSDAVLTLPNPRAEAPLQRRAFLVHVGVDDYSGTVFRSLSWAGADASAMATALARVPAAARETFLLTSSSEAGATRAALEATLRDIAARATPDDLVILTYSGHGFAPPGGEFQLILDQPVSESELGSWLRPIRAREMALVVDACQSAASVEGEGFKPGPLGSKGFGQLAYDKGMLVLAASQSDAFAMESSQLRHGLLSWALAEEGLASGLADANGDGAITLREWLGYGEGRVPGLALAVARGEALEGARAVLRGEDGWRVVALTAAASTLPKVAQRPRLFAFKEAGGLVIAEVGVPPSGAP